MSNVIRQSASSRRAVYAAARLVHKRHDDTVHTQIDEIITGHAYSSNKEIECPLVELVNFNKLEVIKKHVLRVR